MRITITDLKRLIREALREKFDFGGSYPEEDYEVDLLSDPAYEKQSVYVPDEVKFKINKWAGDMGMSRKRKKKS